MWSPDPHNNSSSLAIRLFGSFEVAIHGVPMRRLRSQKGQWLLALLIRNHETVERARLAGLLWPDSNETQAFASLRQSLADLRNALGGEAERLVAPSPQTLSFDCVGADIDILEFDRLIAQGDNTSLERAVALYRGPFLEACHEEWVVLEREQRERSYRAALEQLAQHTSARRSAIRAASQQQEQEAQRPEPLAIIDTRPRAILRVASDEGVTSRLHIPQPLTALIGRQQEAREVIAQLKTTRLVTLLGTGGVGKTRLALHVAETCGDANPDGVWFVDLATVREGNSIPYTVAAALGIREEPGQSVLRTLQQVLSTRQMLLLLDNCEHLLNSCAEFTETLLQTCPGLRILATSQHAFGVIGECGWRVPPLPVPELLVETQTVDTAVLLAYDAVRLFVERAQSISPGFTLKAENAAAIVWICRQLDGIPLALEFAAARVNVLAVEQIADGLADRFRLLSARNALAGSRQKTLLSAMEWSWSLLSEEERILMMRLSLFAGGAPLAATTAICAGGTLDPDTVLDTLDQLCDKSFVLVEEHGGEAFYRLLETTRAYGREKLLASDDDVEALRERHARYFLGLVEEARGHLEGAEQRIWLDRLSAAQEDLRSAFDYFVLGAGAACAANEGIRFAAAFWKYWHTRGSLSEGQRLLTLALERATEISPARVMALGGAGVLALEQGDAGTARRLFSHCLQDAETLQDRPKILWVCNQLGRLAEHEGDPGTAQGYYQQCLDAWTEIGEWRGQVAALNNLGLVAQGLGDYAAATEYHIRCKAINQEFGNSGGIGWSNNNLGELATLQGDLQTAWAYFQEGLTHFAALKNVRGTTTCLLGLATCLLREGNPAREWERATRLFSAAFALRAAIGVNPPLAERIELEQKLARIRTNLDPQKFALAWQDGERMSLDEATAYAMGKSEFLAQPTPSQERLLERHLG